MVVPLSLLTDEGEREFFVEGRDRDVEAVYDFFRAVRVLHGILRRLEKRRAVLLRILRASREEVQDVLGSEAYMDRHLPVLHGEYTLTVLGFVHVEHAAVRGEVCRVGTILEGVCIGLRGTVGRRRTGRCTDHGCRVLDVDLLDSRDAAETADLAGHRIEGAGCEELALPGVVIVTGHVVVCVVTGYDHERTKHDLFITRFLDALDHGFAGGLCRLSFDGADVDVPIRKLLHLGLHLRVGHRGCVARAVAHENEGGAVLRCILEALITGGLHCLGSQRLGDGLLVGVGRGAILSDLPEQRLGDLDGLDFILIGLSGRTELVVLRAVHEVRRLDHEMLDAVVDGTLQRLVHVVDLLAITRLDVIDDDLRSEGTTNRPVRIRRLQRLLDAADILRTAVVEGGTEAHDEKLLLADTVLVQRIVLAGIPGVAAEIIRIGLLTLDERLLRICQLVPGFLRLRALRIGILGPLLYIDRIDQRRHMICRCLIRLRTVLRRRRGRGRCRRLRRLRLTTGRQRRRHQ